MISPIIAVLLCILTAEGCAVLFDSRFERTFAAVLMSVPAILFPWYCLDLLLVGTYFLLACQFAIIVIACVKLKRCGNGGQVLREMLSPGLCGLLVLCIIYMLITFNEWVNLWDELRLWGAFPKLLHHTRDLQLGSTVGSFQIMQSYVPGMPLFIYYMAFFESVFRESTIFFGYALLGGAMFLPVMERATWKDWYKLVISLCAVVLLPCLFYSNGNDSAYYYNSLFIDPTLGLCAGYGLYLAVQDRFEDRGHTVSLMLTVCMLLLLKDTGALLAGLCLVVAGFTLLESKQTRHRFGCFIAIAIPFCYRLIWSALIAQKGITNHVGLTFDKIPWGSVYSFIYAFCVETIVSTRALFGRYVFALVGGIQLSFVGCCVWLLIWLCALLFRMPKNQRAKLTFTAIAFAVASICFCFGYFCIYGETLASFHRYMGTLLTGCTAFLLLYTLEQWFSTDKVARLAWLSDKKYLLGIGALALLIAFCNDWENNRLEIDSRPQAAEASAAILDAVDESVYEGGTDVPARVFLIMETYDPLLHHRIYFDLIGTDACITNFYSQTTFSVGDLATPDSWLDCLIEQDCDFVYLLGKGAAVPDEFVPAFAGDSPAWGTLYSVETDGTVLLKPCEP